MKEVWRVIACCEISAQDNVRPGDMTFYTDGTYRCSFWPEDEVSEWKIASGSIWVKHSGDDWTCCNQVENQMLRERLELELAIDRVIEESVPETSI